MTANGSLTETDLTREYDLLPPGSRKAPQGRAATLTQHASGLPHMPYRTTPTSQPVGTGRKVMGKDDRTGQRKQRPPQESYKPETTPPYILLISRRQHFNSVCHAT